MKGFIIVTVITCLLTAVGLIVVGCLILLGAAEHVPAGSTGANDAADLVIEVSDAAFQLSIIGATPGLALIAVGAFLLMVVLIRVDVRAVESRHSLYLEEPSSSKASKEPFRANEPDGNEVSEPLPEYSESSSEHDELVQSYRICYSLARDSYLKRNSETTPEKNHRIPVVAWWILKVSGMYTRRNRDRHGR